MMGKCALCGEDKELQLSHIIPKFIGKYFDRQYSQSRKSEPNCSGHRKALYALSRLRRII